MTDVSTTKRRPMTPTRRLRIWEANDGTCCLCNTKIDGVKERWFIEHVRALELGGEDTDENCAPAHYTCKAEKDADDHHRAAKAKRAKMRQIGITAPKQKIPGRGFPPSDKAERRQTKQQLPPRRLFQEQQQ